MPDLVVVSNRGPLSFRLDDGGRPVAAGSGGGLAATLRPLLSESGATWVSSSMGAADRQAVDQGLMKAEGLTLVSVDLDPDVYRMAYDVVANATLWFCHHHLFDLSRRPKLDRHWHEAWGAYRAFNRRFAEKVAAHAPDGAIVLVQDYHLCLLGSLLAEARPDLRTVHFSHTPWGDSSSLRTLPTYAAGELLAGMTGFGACGFHTARWEAAFVSCFADAGLAPTTTTATTSTATTTAVTTAAVTLLPRTFHSALGPDPDAIAAEAANQETETAGADLDALTAGRRLIVRVDRIELSKNILRGFWAFDELLETRPHWRDRVMLLALAYPSREGLAEYLAYRNEIEHAAAQLNERWGTPTWTPVVLDLADDRQRSVAALQRSDVLLVNPLRDGMNLVAKEGPLVNRVDGVLVLSREAGAWEELAPAAIGINPTDVSATADALDRALAMDPAERAALATRLRQLITQRTAASWLSDQLAAAGDARPVAR